MLMLQPADGEDVKLNAQASGWATAPQPATPLCRYCGIYILGKGCGASGRYGLTEHIVLVTGPAHWPVQGPQGKATTLFCIKPVLLMQGCDLPATSAQRRQCQVL